MMGGKTGTERETVAETASLRCAISAEISGHQHIWLMSSAILFNWERGSSLYILSLIYYTHVDRIQVCVSKEMSVVTILIVCGTGDQTQGLTQAKKVLCPQATLVAPKLYFSKLYNATEWPFPFYI